MKMQYLLAALLLLSCAPQDKIAPYEDHTLPVDERVADLVSRMTVEEKISQLSHLAPGIPRLDVVPYEPNFHNPLIEEFWEEVDGEVEEFEKLRPWENLEHWPGGCLDGGWWNEALHGVARTGLATAFPQSIGLGCTWRPESIYKMGRVISTEARVHHNVYGKKLTFWSPTINIQRDPRWGRTEESYSEDPFLLSRMAVAFCRGVQGDHPKYLQAITTVKHFVANNSEYNRHDGSSDVSERFLREYYLPAFKAAIMEAGCYSVMGAYNAVNGIPACGNDWLMTDVLRGEWGFKGYVVSDCGAISDIVHDHEYEPDPEKAVALAVIAGTDLECETCEHEQFMYDKYLPGAYEKGYITEDQLDVAVKRLFRARMLLGEFDPEEEVPFHQIGRDQLDSPEHRQLALDIAKETLVLLKNDNGTLPLDDSKLKRVAVIGPNADVAELGGYCAMPAIQISPLQGIRDRLGDKVAVNYAIGCEITNMEFYDWDDEKDEPIFNDLGDEAGTIAEAAKLAKKSDVAIVVLGTNLDIANEADDRDDLELPGNQLALVQQVFKANPRTIVVLMNGMPLSINWVDDNVPAILECWYPGQAGGTAVAEALFGDYNPGGKLTSTWYRSSDDLPHIGDYDITKGFTYWFNKAEVLYPFGYGLSYTTFDYKNLLVSRKEINPEGENLITLSLDVVNTGDVAGEEVVQIYIHDKASSVIQPAKRLKAFQRVSLEPGASKLVSFELDNGAFSFWDEGSSGWIIEPGAFEIQIAASADDVRLMATVKTKS